MLTKQVADLRRKKRGVSKTTQLKRVNANRRGRDGKATAFREVDPAITLIEEIKSPKYQFLGWLCYYTAQRGDASCWIGHNDIIDNKIVFRRRYAKKKRTHRVAAHPKLAEVLEIFVGCGDIPAEGYFSPARKDSKRPVLGWSGFDKAIAKAVDSLVLKGHTEYIGCSSHTFRRSRCQYLYYTQKWPATEVIKISGHKTTVDLLTYIEADENEVAAKYGNTE